MENVVEVTTAAAPQTDIWGMLLFCAIIFAILYFLMILPNKRRMKEYQTMLSKLKVGNRILCAGGIYGTIKKMDDKDIHVEIAKGVVIEIPKNAVVNAE
ncbi:MAG: preprotein translocase subunit YajC [Alphaproteobacteria bacterium]|nr:preprotein translocase subunit YajC [Alphaproteobacteria bacterium]